MKTIRFYSKGFHWYADIPGHTEEENEMVGWCPLVLGFFRDIYDSSDSKDKDIIMSVSDNNETNEFWYKLIRKSHDEDGADYYITKKPRNALRRAIKTIPCWLCNVVHDVFGEHPESIYIHEIRTDSAENR